MTDFDTPFFIKICGVTTLGDANAAVDAGATSIGLNLATSKRHLTVDRALAIAEATKGRVMRTLIFRDNDDDAIQDAVDLVGADAVQIHGALSDELAVRLRERAVHIIKALAIGSDEFYDFDERRVDAVMVDSATPGSGETHSWEELSNRTFVVPIIGAGGLDESNVASVITSTHVWGVDTASGVESAPGVKDRERMTHFVDNARGAFRERASS